MISVSKGHAYNTNETEDKYVIGPVADSPPLYYFFSYDYPPLPLPTPPATFSKTKIRAHIPHCNNSTKQNKYLKEEEDILSYADIHSKANCIDMYSSSAP
jgi:hypothetical protein